MINFESDFLEFRSVRERNREAFLANYATLVEAIPPLLRHFDTLVNVLGSRFADDGNSHAGLIPLLRLAQRQAQSALDSVTSYQAYEGWLLVRPAVEAALIIGKWLDDPNLAGIWNRRLDDPKSYSKEYQGKELRSNSLAGSGEFQLSLRTINDRFAHPNPSYVMRHATVTPVDKQNVVLTYQYFDDAETAEAGCLAMLHLLLVLQEELRNALIPKFRELRDLDFGLRGFRGRFDGRMKELARSSPEHRATLTELGLCKGIT